MNKSEWTFGRGVCLLVLPVNIALTLTAGALGWDPVFLIQFPLTGLLPTTLMALARYWREGELTTSMACAQIAAWLGFLVAGGLGASRASAAGPALAAALTAWLVLFVLLVVDLRRHLVTKWIPEDRPLPSGPASRRQDLGERRRAVARRNGAA